MDFKKILKISMILISCVLIVFLSVQKKAEKENMQKFEELSSFDTYLLSTFIENTNSVMMQQLRMYTMFDDIGYSSSDVKKIHEMLIRTSPKKYKYFNRVAYVNYDTGMSYRDDGLVEDVSDTKWFNIMKEQRRTNKPLQLYYDVSKQGNELIYPIAKDAEPLDEKGLCYGFFVGYIPISYMQHYFNKLENVSSHNFFLLVNNSGQILCSPRTSALEKIFNLNQGFELDEVTSEFVKNFENFSKLKKKEVINGNMSFNGEKYVISSVGLDGTNWVLIKCTDVSFAYGTLFNLKFWYSIICCMLFAIILILLRNMFLLNKN